MPASPEDRSTIRRMIERSCYQPSAAAYEMASRGRDRAEMDALADDIAAEIAIPFLPAADIAVDDAACAEIGADLDRLLWITAAETALGRPLTARERNGSAVIARASGVRPAAYASGLNAEATLARHGCPA